MSNCGGYRVGSGRSKSGYYKGIYCGSTYELCWVIYNLDHGVLFTRFPGKIEVDDVVYYPDFLLDDGKTIIETKGYEAADSVDRKTKAAETLGYTVHVLRREDLQKEFAYVSTVYGTEKYYTLYDEYSPTYTYVCDHCLTSFSTDVRKKTDVIFCSRVCAGKGHTGRSNDTIAKIDCKRKLSKDDALAVFNRTGKSLSKIAAEFGVNKNDVWLIKQKKTYKWIHD